MSWKFCSSDVSRSSLVFLKRAILTPISLREYVGLNFDVEVEGVKVAEGVLAGR